MRGNSERVQFVILYTIQIICICLLILRRTNVGLEAVVFNVISHAHAHTRNHTKSRNSRRFRYHIVSCCVISCVCVCVCVCRSHARVSECFHKIM